MATVLITGGTGLVGKALSIALIKKGHDVTILTRSKKKESPLPGKPSYAEWNIDKNEIDIDALQKCDYIIHLAGANIMEKKWTKEYKQQIVESRTKSSQLIFQVLKNNENRVKAIISASAIGWYGDDKNVVHAKQAGFVETDPPGNDFAGNTCQLWEESVEAFTTLGKRLVKLRTGIVLSKDGGALPAFIKPLRWGISIILGNGRQIMSWIHIHDLCKLFIHALENENISESYNAVAPQPVTNRLFMQKLATALKNKLAITIAIPRFILKILLGSRSGELIKSTTVSCEKILQAGFTFDYPVLTEALKDLTGTTDQ